MPLNKLIDDYLEGPEQLRHAVEGLTEEQLDARPIPGKWSTREVVCHIADFEPIYADRMKRVIAEPEARFLSGDPDQFAAALAYGVRPVEDELQLITSVRRQMATILRTLKPEDFQRTGEHSSDGPLSLETLLRRIEEHLRHHVKLIWEKRNALPS